jgi:2-oxoglutarate dehydrogenase E2 component (dihydrolipoamide succinyltransferase)
MPQLGETVTEGTITKWLKSVGDQISRDEPLFEVSTDKVDSEVPSPEGGFLSEIRVAEGDTVDVGTVLAVISDSASAPAATTASQPDPVAVAPAAATAPEAVQPAPALQPPAPAPSPVAPVDATATPESPNGHSPLLSPVVRRLIDEQGIDPETIRGTGLGGRITRDDVLKHIDGNRTGGAPAATASVAVQSNGSASQQSPVVEVGAIAGTDEVVPFTNIRRRTAEHMVRSRATSAHALVAVEADFEAVERVRHSHGDRFKSEEGFSLTYLPFVARAAVEALHDWPELNASVAADALIVHHQVNLGIAVDLDRNGLIVPVVARAEELTLRGVARRIHELADRARTKRLGADDIVGGTFSITNPGPFGTFITVPIINQPQVAILSTDGVRRRPVVVTSADGTEAVAIHSTGMLALSWDHRAVDGSYAAGFVHQVSELLSTHDWAAEL